MVPADDRRCVCGALLTRTKRQVYCDRCSFQLARDAKEGRPRTVPRPPAPVAEDVSVLLFEVVRDIADLLDRTEACAVQLGDASPLADTIATLQRRVATLSTEVMLTAFRHRRTRR